MVQATQLAAEEINAAGGLLGRKIQVVQYDTQSDIALYTQVRAAAGARRQGRRRPRRHHVGVARSDPPDLRRANILYFYNVLYEGGVCDRNCVVTGTTPAQVMEPIVEIASKQWGKKVYVLAADYNYGQITAKWLAHYVKQRGGSVRRPNSSRSTSPISARPSPRSRRPSPSTSCRRWSAARIISFYRQWAAVRHEQEDPALLDDLRRRQRAPGAFAGRRRRHPDRRQLQPGRSGAGEQGLPRALGQALRRHQDRPRDRRLAVPGHQAVGRGGEEGRLARPREAAEGDRVAGSASRGPAAWSRSTRRRTTPRSTSRSWR